MDRMPPADLTEEEIIQRLAASRTGSPDNPYPPDFLRTPLQDAAILIPLLRGGDSWQILFIRRTMKDDDQHAGQVAFPGGRSEPQDASAETTALREACEEIGLDPSHVRLLGRLDPIVTITNYLVTPVVGAIPWPYPLRIAPEEVSRWFTIPLAWLSEPENFERREHTLPPPHGTREVIYYRLFDGELLWGASARITHNLIRSLR